MNRYRTRSKQDGGSVPRARGDEPVPVSRCPGPSGRAGGCGAPGDRRTRSLCQCRASCYAVDQSIAQRDNHRPHSMRGTAGVGDSPRPYFIPSRLHPLSDPNPPEQIFDILGNERSNAGTWVALGFEYLFPALAGMKRWSSNSISMDVPATVLYLNFGAAGRVRPRRSAASARPRRRGGGPFLLTSGEPVFQDAAFVRS